MSPKPPVASSCVLSPSNDHVLERARARLDEAFDFVHTKAAYLEAKQKAPYLVELESNPDIYLLACNYDPWTVARKIAAYWETRVSLFSDRAFLPMVLCGLGALSPEDIDVLKTGFLMILPDDRNGRIVVCHDRSRLTSTGALDPMRRLRCMFYMSSVISESTNSFRNGVVLISSFGDRTRRSAFDHQTTSEALKIFTRDVFPLRPVGAHLVVQSTRPIVKQVLSLLLQSLQTMKFLPQALHIHQHKPVEELLLDFKALGLEAEGIPKVPLGGMWTIGSFRRWIGDRSLIEKKKYMSVLPSADDGAGNPGCIGEIMEEEERRKKIELSASYSRRKRQRKKIEFEVMQEEVARLQKQQRKLEEKGNELDYMIREAKRIVEVHERQQLSRCTSAE